MTQKTANDVKHLAKSTVEAIQAIAGKVERECPECKGRGKIVVTHSGHYNISFSAKLISCSTCNGTGKVKGEWKWEPEVGEWAWDNYYCGLIIWTDIETCWLRYRDEEDNHVETKNVIPILDWERIEKILEGAGYEVKVEKGLDFEGQHFHTYIRRNGELIVGTKRTKDRQTSVMLAVIELGKEVEK